MAFNVLRMRQRFESQFEPAGEGGYLYRQNWKAVAIPVSAKERDTLARQYAVRIYLVLSITVVAITVLLCVLFLRTSTHAAGQVPPAQIFAGMVAISLVATGLLEWIYRAPSRALKGRPAVGRERTREDVRTISFRRMTYQRLGVTALIGAGSYTYIADGAWDRRWIFVPPLVVLVTAVQAFRKWRFERRHPDILEAEHSASSRDLE
jgi:hypothetical protein